MFWSSKMNDDKDIRMSCLQDVIIKCNECTCLIILFFVYTGKGRPSEIWKNIDSPTTNADSILEKQNGSPDATTTSSLNKSVDQST